MFLLCSLAKNKNCGEPPWPRGSVFGPPWLKFRIMCLAGSVTLLISPPSGFTPGPVYLICAQRWPKTPFITFYFYQAYLDFYKNHLVWTYTCVQTICFPNRSYYILLSYVVRFIFILTQGIEVFCYEFRISMAIKDCSSWCSYTYESMFRGSSLRIIVFLIFLKSVFIHHDYPYTSFPTCLFNCIYLLLFVF